MVLSVRKKPFEWFDKRITNGYVPVISLQAQFALSLSKGEQRVHKQPVYS
jgi:hypothetical protein